MKDASVGNKKKILIYAHYYYPDVAATARLLQELAECLAADFSVTVICAVPSYEGKISEAYRQNKFFCSEWNGVNLLRVRVPPFDKRRRLDRLRNLLAYYRRAKRATDRLPRQDIVFAVSQPPVLGGLLGVYAKKKFKAKLLYNIQDFNPELISSVGYFRAKPLMRALLAADKRVCRAADKIILVGREQVKTLFARFAAPPTFSVIHNWIDESAVRPLPATDKKVAAFREAYGLDGKIVVMYSGNLGLYYDLENILKVFARFRAAENAVFVFIGKGAVEGKLRQYAREQALSNVRFIPYQPNEALLYSLNAADVHIVSNARSVKGISVPSKIYGILACGKFALGLLEKGSDAADIIEESRCGIRLDAGDYSGLEKALRAVFSGALALEEAGIRGRRYLEERLSKGDSLARYREEFSRFSREQPPRSGG